MSFAVLLGIGGGSGVKGYADTQRVQEDTSVKKGDFLTYGYYIENTVTVNGKKYSLITKDLGTGLISLSKIVTDAVLISSNPIVTLTDYHNSETQESSFGMQIRKTFEVSYLMQGSVSGANCYFLATSTNPSTAYFSDAQHLLKESVVIPAGSDGIITAVSMQNGDNLDIIRVRKVCNTVTLRLTKNRSTTTNSLGLTSIYNSAKLEGKFGEDLLNYIAENL